MGVERYLVETPLSRPPFPKLNQGMSPKAISLMALQAPHYKN